MSVRVIKLGNADPQLGMHAAQAHNEVDDPQQAPSVNHLWVALHVHLIIH